MGNKNTIFFDELSTGSTWTAGVAFKRSNALPLDRYSVFETKALAEAYATSNSVAYPGQVIAVAEGNKMVAYVLAENTAGDALVLQQIGIIPTGDGKTISVTEDGQISLLATGDMVAGSQLTLQADGTIKWVKPDTTTAEGQAAAIKALEATVNGVEGKDGLTKRVTALEGEVEVLKGDITIEGSVEQKIEDHVYSYDYLVGEEEVETRTFTAQDLHKELAVLQSGDEVEGSVVNIIGRVVPEMQLTGEEGFTIQQTVEAAETNTEAIATLTGNVKTEGSVDNKIKTALDETKFGTEDNPLGKPQLTLTEMADAINDVEIQINDYIYTNSDGDTFDIYNLDSRIKANAKAIKDTNTRIDVLLDDEGLTETIDSIKEIQEELDKLGEAVQLEEQFAKKADKVTGATAGNFAGLDENGNLTDSGKKAADFAAAVHTHVVANITDFEDGVTGLIQTSLEDYITSDEVDTKIADSATSLHQELIGDDSHIATSDSITGAKKYADSLATNYATAAQGAKADATAATIAGYGDIVTHNAAEFEIAGAAATVKHEVLGDTEATAGPNTILGLKDLIGTVSTKADNAIAAIGSNKDGNGLYDVQKGDADTLAAAKTYADDKDTAIAAADAKGQQGINDAAAALAQANKGVSDAEAARQLAVAAQTDADTNAINIQEIEKELKGYGEGEQKVDGLITKVANNTSRIATLEGTVGEHTTAIGNNATAAQNAQTKADQAYTLAEGKTDLDTVKGLGYAEKTYVDTELAGKANIVDVYTKPEIDGKVESINSELGGKADSSSVYNITEIDDFINTINTYVDTELAKKADATALDAKADKATTYTKEDIDGLLAGKQNTIPAETYDAWGSAATALEDAKKYVDGKNLDQYTTEQEVKDIVDTVVAAAVEGDALEGLTDLVEYINTHGGEAAEMAKAIEALEAKPGLDKEGIVEAITGGAGIVATPIDNGKEYIIGLTEAITTLIAKADTAIQPADIGTMAKETATDYVKKSEATGYTDILTKTEAATTYQPAGEYATAAQGAKADTAVQSVTSLHDAIVVENTNGAVTINFATEIILNGGGADV